MLVDEWLLTSMVIPFGLEEPWLPPCREPFFGCLEEGWGIAPTLANGIRNGAFSPRRGGKWKETTPRSIVVGLEGPIVATTRRLEAMKDLAGPT